MYTRWNTYSSYLKRTYGESVYRVAIDGGFSCPNRSEDGRGGCSFCDGTGAIASYQRKEESGFFRNSAYSESVANSLLPRLSSIEEQAQRGKAFLERRYGARLFSLYFQSFTNTYDSVENLRRIYDRALSTADYTELIISTRPDCLSEEVLDLLAGYSSAVWLELGLQSASDKTLREIGRGHTAECWREAALRAKERGLLICSHIIIGLPGEGREEYLRTIDMVNSVASDGIKIHNLHVPGGTRMGDEYLEGCLTVSSEERYLEDAELCLRHLRPETVVQRLICETPYHRLLAPRAFPDKSLFLSRLERRMTDNDTRQGDLYEG